MKLMKKVLVSFGIFFAITNTANSTTTLVEVYQQALQSDAIFHQAVEQRLSTKEGVPISLSNLLPSASFIAAPDIQKTNSSGSSSQLIGSSTQRGYTMALTLNQTIFNFSNYANLASSVCLSKGADATLNAALQSLMQRVAKAYLAVLYDEDNLQYTVASKEAFAKQLDQVQQQFKVGLKTITDVYTAQASYESSNSDFIAAETQLINDKENLRVITGVFYDHLAKLSDAFPLVSPQPADINRWVETAERQNWSIKSSQYSASSARHNIKQQFGGHLPTLSAQGSYTNEYIRTVSGTLIANSAVPPESNPTPSPTPSPVNPQENFLVKGASRLTTAQANLTLTVPLVQGGLVVANTRKAQYDFQVSMAQLDQKVRETINTTRQSYVGVLAAISKIKADREAIKSSISSLNGLRAAYQVGTGTLVDVVTQQQKVVQAQRTYANDRYTYVNNLIALKAAAGTLSFDDLQAINSWLIHGDTERSSTSLFQKGSDETEESSEPPKKHTPIAKTHYHQNTLAMLHKKKNVT